MDTKGKTEQEYTVTVSLHTRIPTLPKQEGNWSVQPEFASINIIDGMSTEEIGNWVMKQIYRQEYSVGRDG